MKMRKSLFGIVIASLVFVFLLPANVPAVAATNQLPIQILNVVTMKSPFQVNSEKPFSMPKTMPSIPSGKASLNGFSNTTLSKGNSELMVSVGNIKGTSIVYLQYIEVANTYTVTIMESLARNASSSSYLGVLGANIVPTGV